MGHSETTARGTLVSLVAFACCTVLAASFVACQAAATERQTPSVGSSASARNAALLEYLRKSYPGPDFRRVRETAIPGLYEVTIGQDIGYVDESGRYLIQGQLLDLKEKKNLSQAALEVARTIDVHDLPLSDAIKIVRGDGSRVLYAFVDPDCPFCKDFDTAIASMTNYTAYLFLYPLTGIHPDAMRKSIAIWCAQDREKAWIDVVRNGKPIDAASCDNPVERGQRLATKLSIESTPTIILSSGKRYAGGWAPTDIEAALNSSH